MRRNAVIRKLALAGCLVVLLHGLTFEASGQNTDIKSELRQRFQNKIFLIRGWYQDAKLTYDATGAVIGTPTRGPWTASLVKIHSIKIRANQFVLKGPRGGDAYDRKNKKFGAVIAEKPEVTITVQTDTARLTAPDLDALQNAIFAQNAKTEDMPEYWRDFLVQGEQDPKTAHAADAGQSEAVPASQSNSQPVLKVGTDVSPPRILKQSEPEFTEVARGARYQGTVVVRAVIDKQGIPTKIRLTKVVGMGLDDEAVKTVEQWRFIPAQRDGKPVAVFVDIEVNFKLY